MKIVVFVNSGLGNAVLLAPLLNRLKQRGDEITCISTASYGGRDIFQDSDLIEEVIDLGSEPSEWIKFNIKYKGAFDEAYLDNFASTRKIILSAQIIAKKVIAQKIPNNLPGLLTKKCREVKPESSLHSAVQNLRLLDENASNTTLNYQSISLTYKGPASKHLDGVSSYIAIQLGSANDIKSFKNWRIDYWIEFISNISIHFPDFQIILLGEASEQPLADQVRSDLGDAVISLIGKTTIEDLKSIISNCELFIGVDSGLMHVAAAYNRPTFTLWGPSDPGLYGYEIMDSQKHRAVSLHLACSPCNSWLSPNTSRVKNPEECPDFRCMLEMTPEIVYNEFERFAQNLNANFS